jgi:predicted Zn-dependent protease
MLSINRVAIVTAVAMLMACAKNPVTGRRQIVLISESQEIAMGAQAHVSIKAEFGVLDQPAVQDYVQQVGKNIAAVSHRPNLDWHFTAVDSPVINAFALPGGYVYFTRGILAYFNNEAEFAGVMGHEVGHITARHAISRMTRSQAAQFGLGAASVLSPTAGQFGGAAGGAFGLWFLRFSRDDERQADQLGVEYAARAGYDPREVSNFFEVLQRLAEASDRETMPGWLSTHPDPGERVKSTRAAAQQWIDELGLTPQQMVVNRDEHLRSIDGIVFGDNPRQGFIEDGRYNHPDLQFQIHFPSGWRIENTRAAVLAFAPENAAQIQLRIADAPQGTTASSYARQITSRGLSLVSGGPTSINGNPAWMGLFTLRTESGATRPVVAALIEYRQRLYEILGPMNSSQRYRSTIESAIRTFDQLTDSRILSMQPDRVRIYNAREGDTIEAIAQRNANPRVTADDLSVLNRIAAGQTITAGSLIKVVEKGY